MPIGTFIDEKDDVELLDILPILLELQNVSEATGFHWSVSTVKWCMCICGL
jgi:hypothetical protein